MIVIRIMFLILLALPIRSQELIYNCDLPTDIQESSGLVNINGRIFSHNDSGGEARLYEIDPDNCELLRSVEILSANNVDWEDICADDEFVYIADFGNNSGSRKDLKIYKVKINDVLNLNSCEAEVISFSYEDQTDFTPSNRQTNFDAESLIAHNDSLYIFSKNWGDFKTKIYSIPKIKGEYIAKKLNLIQVNSLVTGADIDLVNNRILLSSYQVFIPQIIEIELEGFPNSINYQKHTVQIKGSPQIEAICNYKGNYLVSAESFNGSEPELYTYHTKLSSIEKKDEIYSIDSNKISFKTEKLVSYRIFNVNSMNMDSQFGNIVDMNPYPRGVYFIQYTIDGKNDVIRFVKE